MGGEYQGKEAVEAVYEEKCPATRRAINIGICIHLGVKS